MDTISIGADVGALSDIGSGGGIEPVFGRGSPCDADGDGDGGGIDDDFGRVSDIGDKPLDLELGGSALDELAPRRSPMIGGSIGATSRRSAAGEGDSALSSSGLGGGGNAGALSRLTRVVTAVMSACAVVDASATGPDRAATGVDQLDDSDTPAGSGTPVAGG